MDIEVDDNVWIAAGDGSIERTLAFLGTGSVDVADENGYTPLMAACAYGHIDLVRELLRRGADPNRKDSDGNTPVHHCDYASCLKELVEAGAKVSIRNNDGQTALEVKEEELTEAKEEFSDEEELDEGEESSEKRLQALVDGLNQAAVEEETRKKKRT